MEINYTGSVLTASTISSPWTPVTGPQADSNGPGPDTKNLDVGDMSDMNPTDIVDRKSFICKNELEIRTCHRTTITYTHYYNSLDKVVFEDVTQWKNKEYLDLRTQQNSRPLYSESLHRICTKQNTVRKLALMLISSSIT
ncbi:unnamed protein product [Diabrotica balteata]|uniref:Uncharacterized protein n=1 Tax=Diabrotica balteata TaxID=107213 RepID=A0A9N9SS72_DIABA|nr:unnamed protein product [Diabrotica balteata]